MAVEKISGWCSKDHMKKCLAEGGNVRMTYFTWDGKLARDVKGEYVNIWPQKIEIKSGENAGQMVQGYRVSIRTSGGRYLGTGKPKEEEKLETNKEEDTVV